MTHEDVLGVGNGQQIPRLWRLQTRLVRLLVFQNVVCSRVNHLLPHGRWEASTVLARDKVDRVGF